MVTVEWTEAEAGAVARLLWDVIEMGLQPDSDAFRTANNTLTRAIDAVAA